MEKFELKTPEGTILRWVCLYFFKFYLQESYQLLIVRIREKKSSCGFSRGRGKGTILK